MRILLSNDDGYLARGINVLHDALQPLGEVTVMAPEQNCSGSSNSLTLSRPLSIHQAANGFNFVNGTPTDSVHIALNKTLQNFHALALHAIRTEPRLVIPIPGAVIRATWVGCRATGTPWPSLWHSA